MTEAIAVVTDRAIAPVQDWDVLQMLLDDHRSPNTRRAYERDLRLFFAWWLDEDPHPEAIASASLACNPALMSNRSTRAWLATLKKAFLSLRSFSSQ